ncbi:hypothetical protein Ciccas_010489 [Cichlidogyrus casuarinus]|uniref:Profilin n=1 Tax=Cichlidogyrus casuarinus TaxID=1844966 RepID=A0ABD2PV50_9PLAT
MSWDSYITNLKQYSGVQEACLCGQDGSIWAKSDGFQMQPQEVSVLAKNTISGTAAESVSYNGNRAVTVRCSDGAYMGKLGDQLCLAASATKTGVVITAHLVKPGDKMPVSCLQLLHSACETVSNYLKDNNI